MARTLLLVGDYKGNLAYVVPFEDRLFFSRRDSFE
jgi:hypothetical protein